MEKDIQLTDSDYRRLKTLLRSDWIDREDGSDLKRLEHELDRSRIVKATEIPQDVVTMNSRVKLRDLDSGDAVEFSLVFPPHPQTNSDHLASMKVSILAPIGTAVLGYRAGDTIEWEVPAGVRRLRIEEVSFQPEAVGRYDL